MEREQNQTIDDILLAKYLSGEMDGMEQQGIVGALDGAKPRQVLISKVEIGDKLGGQHNIPLDVEEPPEGEYNEDDE